MPRTSRSAAFLRESQVLPVAMFLGSFAWSFVYVSLPFHIQRVSTWDAVSTLRWTGWILGISPLAHGGHRAVLGPHRRRPHAGRC